MENDALKTLVTEIVKEQLASELFQARKLTDTPTDDLMVVPRKYVNLNGASSARPTSSVVGQFYFDTTLHKPVWWDGTGFRDGAGNYV